MEAVSFMKEWKRLCSKYGQGCEGCPMNIDDICLSGTPRFYIDEVEKIVEKVENWAKTHPVFDISEQQEAAIRGRIAEGAKWVFRDSPTSQRVYFSDAEPERENSILITLKSKKTKYYSSCNGSFYRFVNWENSPIYLPDLLGGEE